MFLFERNLDRHVLDVIRRFSNSKQTLVFCTSKNGTENLAAMLAAGWCENGSTSQLSVDYNSGELQFHTIHL